MRSHHPAQYSPELFDVFLKHLPPGAHLHDPFAGPGERLGRFADEHGFTFSGTELEPEFIIDSRVVAGDATDPSTYPSDCVIVTSPAYPNGMCDHFEARDSSRRHTYRQALAATIGYDRPLAVTNMGRYGVRSGRRAEAAYWEIAAQAVSCWEGRPVALNVSDFLVARRVYPCVRRWSELLEEHGLTFVDDVPVETRRQRHGANGDLRVDREHVLLFSPRTQVLERRAA